MLDKKFRVALSSIGGLIVAGAAALVAIGCSPEPATLAVSPNCDLAYTSKYCTKGAKKCDVDINITACGSAPTVVPASLSVCETKTKITWHLNATGTATGAKFAANGIDFSKSDPNQIDFKVAHTGKVDYEVTDEKSKGTSASPDPYDYGIHILKSDASDCYHHDPRISNE